MNTSLPKKSSSRKTFIFLGLFLLLVVTPVLFLFSYMHILGAGMSTTGAPVAFARKIPSYLFGAGGLLSLFSSLLFIFHSVFMPSKRKANNNSLNKKS